MCGYMSNPHLEQSCMQQKAMFEHPDSDEDSDDDVDEGPAAPGS